MCKRDLLSKGLLKEGFEIGCYDPIIEKVPKKYFEEIIYQALNNDTSNIKVLIRKAPYIIEIDTMDNEKDFSILSLSEYEDRYGEYEEW